MTTTTTTAGANGATWTFTTLSAPPRRSERWLCLRCGTRQDGRAEFVCVGPTPKVPDWSPCYSCTELMFRAARRAGQRGPVQRWI